MRILFDCRYTRTDGHDGISRFTSSLVGELAKLHEVEMLVSDERQLALLPALPWHLIASPTSVLEPLVARAVNRLSPDVVFSPMQTMGSWGRGYKLVLTVHDLIYYRHPLPPRELPGFVRVLWRLYHLSWWPQRMLLNRADAVVAVSETTRELIVEHRLTKRRVAVVRNAASEPSALALAAAAGRDVEGGLPQTEPRTIVYMGSFMPYKNVDALVRALELLPGYELHLMSRIGDAERRRLVALAPGARLSFHDGASDAEYERELLRATALVTASRDEGFGIPIVEAMRLGVPAVVSDIPIFREVGGEAAVYVDPESPADVARGIRSLEPEPVWRERSRRSVEQAARFSWGASAQQLLALLESL